MQHGVGVCMIDPYDWVGLVAGTLTTGSYVPQFVKAWRSKSTHDLSIVWLLMLAIGLVVWVAYGFLITSFAVVATNVVLLLLVVALILLKASYEGMDGFRKRA